VTLRLLLLFALSWLACSPGRLDEAPSLRELPLAPDVKASGARLMRSPDGLHRLDANGARPLAVIAVHGGDSQGYEWIYALHELARRGVRVYFHRYDFRVCPAVAAEGLGNALHALLADGSIKRLRVMGHSYGGVVTALMASTYHERAPLEVDLIASPLAGIGSLNDRCKYKAPHMRADSTVVVRQWRTRQALDNAFKDLKVDPQQVDLPGQVTTLGDSYRGNRLGHNWSISAVVDQLEIAP
jgi:pimeloyl-ACP methyl ester carboxylesterase